MKTKDSRLLVSVLFVLLLIIMALLIACGEKEETTTSAAVTTTTQAPSTTQAASTSETTQTTKAPESKAKVLRLAFPWPPGDDVTNNILMAVDAFNAQAAGKYVIEPHPGGSLLALPDSFDALRSGGVEMAGWPVAVFGSIVPMFNLAELPFAVNTMEGDAAYIEAMGPLYQKALKPYGIRLVFSIPSQGLDLIGVKHVKTLEEWKGLLCQTISPNIAKVVESLGGSGVAIDFTETYQALSKKVVDVSPTAISMVMGFKIYEVGKYITKCYLTPACLAIYMNQKVYDEMPPDIQTLVDNLLGKEIQSKIIANMVQNYHDNYAKMPSLGVDVYPLPKAERDRWAERVKPWAEELLSKVDPADADQVRQITQQLDQQYPYKD